MRVGLTEGTDREGPDSRWLGVVRRSAACRKRVRMPRGREAGHGRTPVVHGPARTGAGSKMRRGFRGDDPKTRDAELGRSVAENGETRRTTSALVGGVQDLEERGGRPDDGTDAEERRPCSRGATGWHRLSGMP